MTLAILPPSQPGPQREDMKSALFLSGLARAQKPIVARSGSRSSIGTTLLLTVISRTLPTMQTLYAVR